MTLYSISSSKFENILYTNAFINYNKNRLKTYNIQFLNNSTLRQNKLSEEFTSLEKLPEIINYALSQSSNFNILFDVINPNSLLDIFPPFNMESKIVNDNIKSFNYLGFMINGVYIHETEEIDLFSNEVEEEYSAILLETPEQLTRNQAIALLQQYQCTQAIELSESNTILFEKNGNCFYITYGNPCIINELDSLYFDIENGFQCPSTFQGHKQEIYTQLQTHFTTWKKSNYKNELFSNMNVTYDKNAKTENIASNKMPQSTHDSLSTLIKSLSNYQVNRKKNEEDYYHPTKIASYLPFWRFKGYTRTEKLEAVTALVDILYTEKRQLSKRHMAVYEQGNLKDLITTWEKQSSTTLEKFLKDRNVEIVDDQPTIGIFSGRR